MVSGPSLQPLTAHRSETTITTITTTTSSNISHKIVIEHMPLWEICTMPTHLTITIITILLLALYGITTTIIINGTIAITATRTRTIT